MVERSLQHPVETSVAECDLFLDSVSVDPHYRLLPSPSLQQRTRVMCC